MDFLLRMTLNSFSSSIIGARGDGWHGAVVAAPCLPLRRLSLRRLRHQSTWRFLSRRRAATPYADGQPRRRPRGIAGGWGGSRFESGKN
jgi:hypothetical protein